MEENDDEWAMDWIVDIKGPDLEEFAEIYEENGFDRSKKAIGNTLYLIVRTVLTFIKVCRNMEYQKPICIAFHDQDPIMRVRRD